MLVIEDKKRTSKEMESSWCVTALKGPAGAGDHQAYFQAWLPFIVSCSVQDVS